MLAFHRHILITAAVLMLAACGQDVPVERTSTLFVFGTKVEITVRGQNATRIKTATARLTQDFARMQKDWHAWKPGELSALNSAFANGESTVVSPFLLPLIKQAKTLYDLSDGTFNPAIGAIIGAWGFHADTKPQGGLPDLAAIRAMTARKPAMTDVKIDGNRVSSSNPLVQLDFGGFAKGVALDHAEQVFKGLGIENALINAGGDINTLGDGGDRPWQVGIQNPKSRGIIATLRLNPGEDVYTSGNYERFREIDGVRYAHIIDPRTGMPVNRIVSATVLAYSGALADGAATALTVAGPDDWYRIARKMGIKSAVLVDDRGTVYLNPALKTRLTFAPGLALKIVESPPL